MASAPAATASAAPSSAIRTRFVCQGTSGSLQAELLGEPPQDLEALIVQRRERSGRAAELHREPVVADPRQPRLRLEHATSQPAAFSPNVVGTACCSSVRPAITVAR